MKILKYLLVKLFKLVNFIKLDDDKVNFYG